VGHGGPGQAGALPSGDGGAGGTRDLEAVIVDAGGLVFVRYLPASEETSVSVTLDPQCLLMGATVDAQSSVCADLALSGEIVGDAEVCFVSDPSTTKTLGECVIRDQCKVREDRLRSAMAYCCGRYPESESTHLPGVCMRVTELGPAFYGPAYDSDGDYSLDFLDNCPHLANFGQSDIDGDEIGTACDNCVYVWNQDQSDADHDRLGDACDPDFGAGGAAGAGP
jgi:Thrombospondin type 3 repeat